MIYGNNFKRVICAIGASVIIVAITSSCSVNRLDTDAASYALGESNVNAQFAFYPVREQTVTDDDLPVSLTATKLPSRDCDLNAESPLLHSENKRFREVVENNAASKALPPGKDAISRETALSIAESQRTDRETNRNLPGAAISVVPYADAMKLLGAVDVDGIIAPDRCVYVVTVHATMAVGHGPEGVDISKMVYDSYTVVIDAASGDQLAMTTGPGVANLITGEGLGTPVEAELNSGEQPSENQ